MEKLELSNGQVLEVETIHTPDGILKEFDLPDGIARVRVAHVPPMLVSNAISKRFADIPKPMVHKKGIAGDVWLEARPGTPEYETWKTEQDNLEKNRDDAHSVATWNYAVVEWKLLSEDKWQSDPPKGWKLSKRMLLTGITPRKAQDGRRADYIQYVVIITNLSLEAVQTIMYGHTESILKQEVDAVRDLFQRSEEQDANTVDTAQ